MKDLKKAIILCGGWEGHDPKGVTARFRTYLESKDTNVRVITDVADLSEKGLWDDVDLFVPVCTSGVGLTDAAALPLIDAVERGMGVAGCHGGMNDLFRDNVLWGFVAGSRWISHPTLPWYHCTPCVPSPEGAFFRDYTVRIRDHEHFLTRGIEDFTVHTEQYYFQYDPAVRILADCVFSAETDKGSPYIADGKDIVMPVIYTRQWGNGRVYFNALGHDEAFFRSCPQAVELMERGLLWAMCEEKRF